MQNFLLCVISSTFASSSSSDPAGRLRDLGTRHFGANATFNFWNFHQFKSTMFKLTATVGILALAVSGGTFHLNRQSEQSYPSRANLPYQRAAARVFRHNISYERQIRRDGHGAVLCRVFQRFDPE